MSKGKIWAMVEIFAIGILLILLIFFAKRKIDDHQFAKEQAQWKSVVQTEIAQVDWKANRDQMAIEQVEKIREKYPAVIGIIEIPGTDILFPIVQGEDNEFYLHHDKEGNKHPFGEIFLDRDNNPNFTDQNSVIYGHNIRQAKTLFNGLLQYENQEFYETHKEINVYTLDGFKGYEVVSAFHAKPEEPYRETQFENIFTYKDFQNKYMDFSTVKTNGQTINNVENRKMLTLSTCFTKTVRMVVQGVERIEE